jgi:BON domain-containing protein
MADRTYRDEDFENRYRSNRGEDRAWGSDRNEPVYDYGRYGADFGRGENRGWSNQGQGGYGQGSYGQGGYGQTGRNAEPWQSAGPFTGRGPKGYQRSDDRIREEVCERLTRHGHLDASGIDVNVRNGEVTLEGTVEHRRDKRVAEDAIESISGVKDVHNHLRVEHQHAGTAGASGQQGQAQARTPPTTAQQGQGQSQGQGQERKVETPELVGSHRS